MPRRKLNDVQDLAQSINDVLERYDASCHIFIGWGGEPRRARAYLMDNPDSDGVSQMERELSPRLPLGKMYDWLETFLAGLSMGADLGIAPPPKAWLYPSETGRVFTTHLQECPICEHDLTIACDNALLRGGRMFLTCPECLAPVTIDSSEEIAWTITGFKIEEVD